MPVGGGAVAAPGSCCSSRASASVEPSVCSSTWWPAGTARASTTRSPTSSVPRTPWSRPWRPPGSPSHALGGSGQRRPALDGRPAPAAGAWAFRRAALPSPYTAAFGRLVALSVPRRDRPVLVYTEHSLWNKAAIVTKALNRVTVGVDGALIVVSVAARDALPRALRSRARVVVHGVDRARFAALLDHRDGRAPRRAQRARHRRGRGAGPHRRQPAQREGLRRAPRGGPPGRDGRRSRALRIRRTGPARGRADPGGRRHGPGRAPAVPTARAPTPPGSWSVPDVFVLPSHQEGLPVALMEAMTTGLPVVATLVGGVPDVITDGVEGLLVLPGRADLLADAVTRLARDAALRARLAQASLARSAALRRARGRRRHRVGVHRASRRPAAGHERAPGTGRGHGERTGPGARRAPRRARHPHRHRPGGPARGQGARHPARPPRRAPPPVVEPFLGLQRGPGGRGARPRRRGPGRPGVRSPSGHPPPGRAQADGPHRGGGPRGRPAQVPRPRHARHASATGLLRHRHLRTRSPARCAWRCGGHCCGAPTWWRPRAKRCWPSAEGSCASRRSPRCSPPMGATPRSSIPDTTPPRRRAGRGVRGRSDHRQAARAVHRRRGGPAQSRCGAAGRRVRRRAPGTRRWRAPPPTPVSSCSARARTWRRSCGEPTCSCSRAFPPARACRACSSKPG